MSLKIVYFPLYLLLLPCCLLLLDFVVANPKGFTMKLIHRDSIESPLYPGNRTVLERLHRMQNQTEHRLFHISSLIKSETVVEEPNAAVRPEVFWDTDNLLYLSHVCIGNEWRDLEGKYFCHNYFLGIDTGSNDIWTQCEGCKHCFKQKYPDYPYYKSHTYHSLPCNQHPLCTPNMCRGPYCSYSVNYVDGSSTEGVLATEKFYFQSDTAFHEVVDNVVFGCGSDQKNWDMSPHNKMSGLLGLGWGPRSFFTQLGDRAGGQMSYCLQSPGADTEGVSTLLQFGDDAKFPGGALVKFTPFQVYENRYFYYLKLLDISVGDRKLNFPPRTFDLKVDGTGGCIIDIGTSLTSMYRSHYNVVRAAVMQYFATTRLKILKLKHMDLCYQGKLEEILFPTITLHFEHSDLVVSEHGFITLTENSFCLAMKPNDNAHVPVLIGDNFQRNYRFLYNIQHGTLYFAEEDCGRAQ